MERKNLQDTWNEIQDQISEWWDDRTNGGLGRFSGDQGQVSEPLQTRDGYFTTLAIGEIKVRMRNYNPKNERREKHFGDEDWLETNNGESFYKPRIKEHARSYAKQK